MIDLKRFDDFYGLRGKNKDALEYLKTWDYIDLPLAECLTGKCDLDSKEYEQSDDVYDIIGGDGCYITVKRDDEFSQFRFMGACRKGKSVNVSSEFRNRIYICSPFRSRDKAEQDFYIWFAKQQGKDVLKRGDIPVIPHLYFPQLMDDDIPEDRELSLEFGKRILKYCDAMWVCRLSGYLSEGMKGEVDYARNYTSVEIAEDFCPRDFWEKKYREEMQAESEG